MYQLIGCSKVCFVNLFSIGSKLGGNIPKDTPRLIKLDFPTRGVTHGFLAPHSKVRSKLAISRRELKGNKKNKTNEEISILDKAGKIKWARLLKRVFAIDVETCSFCGGKTKMLSAIHEEASIKKILTHIGLEPNPPPIKSAKQIVMGF